MASPFYYRMARWVRDNFTGWENDTEVAAADNREESDTEPYMGEMGTTGLDVRGGRIRQEYNAELKSLSDRMTTFEEMRRSESAVAAMEQIIALPIRQAEWSVEPGDDKEFGEFVEWNLFEGLSHSFDDLLREALLAVLYGFAVHEKVFERKRQGYIGWRKFAERDRGTIKAWRFDNTGGLSGIKQKGHNLGTGVLDSAEIPIKKLIVWTWRKEAGNPEGLGALRQAYKHWYYKQVFEEFAAIRIERQASGVPVAHQPPEGAVDSEVKAVWKLLTRIRTGEDAGIVAPSAGWEFGTLDLGNADVPFESHIERQHQSMLQTILGQFVGLAQGGDSGAWALSRDTSSFFLHGLETVADWFCSYFNRYCVAQLVRYNLTGHPAPPRLVHGPLGVRDPDDITLALSRIFDPEKPMPEDIEDYMRDELNLPRRDGVPARENVQPKEEEEIEDDND